MNVPTSIAERAPTSRVKHRQERALLGRDLHAGDRAERRGLLDQRPLHGVGRRAVRDEVVGELGESAGTTSGSAIEHARTLRATRGRA